MLSIYKSKSKKLKPLARNLYTGIHGSLCVFHNHLTLQTTVLFRQRKTNELWCIHTVN